MESLFCIVCGKEVPQNNLVYCSRSCQGKKQGKTANFSHTISPQWDEVEIDVLRLGYELDIPVDVIAAQLSRSSAGVYCKAEALGFTNKNRKKRPEFLLKMSIIKKQWWKTLDYETKMKIVSHPCSEETRKKIGTSLRNSEKYRLAMCNPELKQKQSNILFERIKNGDQTLRKGYSNGRMGIREDIKNCYFRSSWEANYARYLNTKQDILKWEYEPERFIFNDISKGTRSYLPDFRVYFKNGTIEYHEVKGYWTSKGKTAVKRFKKYYPQHVLIIIDGKEYNKIRREYGELIPNWEK